MPLNNNLFKKTRLREITESTHLAFQRSCQVTPSLVRRIGLEADLEGHNGCVNCLEWNESGSLLASGSDDVQVIIWRPDTHKALTTIATGHHGNIFSVKFLPSSNDGILVSGAADCKIRVHDIKAKETTHVFSCHAGRVKRLATAPNVPFMFWSAAEDGTIMQFDLRAPETSSNTDPKNVLINLNAHLGAQAEAKCLAVNPMRPEQIAVGVNDPYVRMYDRRMLTCKSIKFPSESSTRSQYDHDSMLLSLTSEEEFSLPHGAARYYVAGHLPQKQHDYRKRYRTLASTYLTFSPDGTELLVNLGGEQIYLFDVNRDHKPLKFDIPLSSHTNGVVKGASTTNGLSLHCNGASNGVSKHLLNPGYMADPSVIAKPKNKRSRATIGKPLPPMVDLLKQKANSMFEKEKYNQAILVYNQAIALAPDAPVLYGNRAATFMKRAWDGDLYAALRDCHTAISLDGEHMKAHLRLARCLFELDWTSEANDCLKQFKFKFPDFVHSRAYETLDRDITHTINSHQHVDQDSDDKSDPDSPIIKSKRRKNSISDKEKMWRAEAQDYAARFCGHCNTTTDIKEANFFGSNGQYIVAGSDDGSFFMWERRTSNIVRVLHGDDSIVNCLQPHPSSCLLATSGIDPVVRLWSPRPEDGRKDDREIDNSDDAASANQKRMNADPLEVMLMNMGYRINVLDGEDGEAEMAGGANNQCRPS